MTFRGGGFRSNYGGSENPRSYYFTTGLLTRQPRTLTETQIINTEGVLSFNPTAFQLIAGGVRGISFTDMQDESDADPTGDAENAVVQFPAGIFHFGLEFYGNQTPNQNVFLGLYKIQRGIDDVEEFASRTRQKEFFGTEDSDIDAVYRVEEKDVVLDQSDKFYFRLGNFSGTTQNRIAGYFRIEKIK